MEPFRWRHRVGFGECDPARIFYAPRGIAWSVEAAEAFSEEVLGLSWAGLLAREGHEVRVLSFDCTYERSVAASEAVELAVEAGAASPAHPEPVEGGGTLELRVVATRAAGDVSFRTSLALGLFEAGGGGRVAIPEAVRSRLSPPPEPAPGRSAPRPDRVEERATPRAPPFTRVRRVTQGDCGPSGDAHAARVAEWAVEAVGEWYEETLGISWIEQCRRGLGTPFLRIACPRLARMEAGARVTMEVAIPRLGNASIGYAVTARGDDGAVLFEADMAACHITEESGQPRPRAFPDPWRARIEAYRTATGG